MSDYKEQTQRDAVFSWFTDNGYSAPVESEITDLLNRVGIAQLVQRTVLTDPGVRFAVEQRTRVLELEAQLATARQALTEVADKVSSGRLCYFGDHTGYTPQFSSLDVDRLRALAQPTTETIPLTGYCQACHVEVKNSTAGVRECPVCKGALQPTTEKEQA